MPQRAAGREAEERGRSAYGGSGISTRSGAAGVPAAHTWSKKKVPTRPQNPLLPMGLTSKLSYDRDMGRFCLDPLSKEQKPLNNRNFADMREGGRHSRKATREERQSRRPGV